MKTSVVQNERTPLLEDSDEADSDDRSQRSENEPITTWQLAGLYTAHTLSMWNSRSYEFAAVLFTTSAYPHTLTVASLRGLSANLASLLLSPAVGRWCNKNPSRLWPLQLCIISQRICILLACIGWTIIVQENGIDQPHNDKPESRTNAVHPIWLKHTIMAVLIVFGMLEKLFWVGNIIVVERDWVPCLASPTTTPALHVLNANVKRIDLISKLVAPLAVSGIALGINNYRIIALIIAAMQLATIFIELFAITRVWRSSMALQSTKKIDEPVETPEEGILNSFQARTSSMLGLLRRYVASQVFIPSVAWAVQPFSVLTLSASMMVYLLSIHFPLDQITIARTLSTGVEIMSTILTPIFISWLRRREKRRTGCNAESFQPLIRVGIFGLSWHLSMLIPATICLVYLPNLDTDPTVPFPSLTKVLLVCLALSRLGPFAYALVEQQLVQVVVPVDHRVEFSGTEMALFSGAEVLRWTSTGVFGKPSQFKGVALGSFAVVLAAAVTFWRWTWKWRDRLGVQQIEQDDSDGDPA